MQYFTDKTNHLAGSYVGTNFSEIVWQGKKACSMNPDITA